MADQKQVEILKRGAKVWNKWKGDNISRSIPIGAIDLRRANLRGVDLMGANLTRADFSNADLSEANLCASIS